MGCPNLKNAGCMLDPKYHKPDFVEISGYCDLYNVLWIN